MECPIYGIILNILILLFAIDNIFSIFQCSPKSFKTAVCGLSGRFIFLLLIIFIVQFYTKFYVSFIIESKYGCKSKKKRKNDYQNENNNHFSDFLEVEGFLLLLKLLIVFVVVISTIQAFLLLFIF